MTNSEVVQFIIEKLNDSPLKRKGDKELFELIFAPIKYGNENESKRKIAKQFILDIFKNHKNFNKTKFNKLVDNIVCGKDEKKYRKETLEFIQSEIKQLRLMPDIDTTKLIDDIPCKKKNYRSHFSNWKKKETAIHDQNLKNALQKNFDFQSKLWDRGDSFIKESLERGTKDFIKKHTTDNLIIIDPIIGPPKDEFFLDDLAKIKDMDKENIKQYIQNSHPLSENRSRRFIWELISILYAKRYYELLLYDVLETLDEGLKEEREIKKIKVHVWGSSAIGEYKKAFDLLNVISSNENDTKEIIDMKTELISNMLRYQLNDTRTDDNQKKKILQRAISHYRKVFNHDNLYHYYPGINLAYMLVIDLNLFDKEINQDESIDKIYAKSKKSIGEEKQSLDNTTKYFAHITAIEFVLLRDIGNPLIKLEQFLELEKQMIPLVELERTQRQMQFFVDTVNAKIKQKDIVLNMQKAIELIDDFIDYQSQ